MNEEPLLNSMTKASGCMPAVRITMISDQGLGGLIMILFWGLVVSALCKYLLED